MFLLLALIASALIGFTVGLLVRQRSIRRAASLRVLEMTRLLISDPLTGLLNRDGLFLEADAAPLDPPTVMILMLLDIDNFKAVNDTFGHQAGDELLVTVARRIKDVVAGYDGTAARLSGDEYAALVPAADRDPSQIAALLVSRVAEPVYVRGADGITTQITPTVSVGVTVAQPDEPFEAVAMRHADAAMYHAKHRGGGNTHRLYQPGMTMPTVTGRRGPRPRDHRTGQVKP
ncbi:GGDEF domain-containing protein [Asanoa sp. NPDC050611]|uniref:GGDEF domain-containing protein n=1 Tax=Asanoa sp. NPDC050611 TaxID=3157098 RepID=UPI0033EDD47F